MFSPPIFLCYYWLVLVFLLNFVALDVLSAADEFVFNQFTSTPSINVVAPMFIGQVVLATLFAACPEIFECSPPPLKKRPPIGRERRSVRSIMNELGESRYTLGVCTDICSTRCDFRVLSVKTHFIRCCHPPTETTSWESTNNIFSL
jgi:hypothetical protein